MNHEILVIYSHLLWFTGNNDDVLLLYLGIINHLFSRHSFGNLQGEDSKIMKKIPLTLKPSYFWGGCRGVLYHDTFLSSVPLISVNQIQVHENCTHFWKAVFFLFHLIPNSSHLNTVKLKVGHDLNNMKSMEKI